MCDWMANTTDKRTQQILGAVLAFWCVDVPARCMLCVTWP